MPAWYLQAYSQITLIVRGEAQPCDHKVFGGARDLIRRYIYDPCTAAFDENVLNEREAETAIQRLSRIKRSQELKRERDAMAGEKRHQRADK